MYLCNLYHSRYLSNLEQKICFFLFHSWTLFFVTTNKGYLYGPKAWWYYMLVAEFALVPLHCIWIYLLCTFRFEIQSMSVSFLSCRALSNLGDISYSLYVLHYPILYAYTNLKAWAIVPYQMRDREIKMGLDTLVEGTYFLETYEIAGVLGIVIVFAYFAHSYIEEPARRYLTANRSSKK